MNNKGKGFGSAKQSNASRTSMNSKSTMFTHKSIQPRQSQLNTNGGRSHTNRNQRLDYTKNSNLSRITPLTFSGLAFRDDETLKDRTQISNHNLFASPNQADSCIDLRQSRGVAN